VAVGQFRTSDVKMPEFEEGITYAVFRDVDIDRNGFLEWDEYQICLEKSKEYLKLS